MNESRPRKESELIELLRAADVRAPEALHRHVQELIDGQTRIARHRSLFDRMFGAGRSPVGLRLGGALVAAAAAIAALAVGLTGGGAPALSLREAAALTLRPATMVAPAESHAHPTQLAATVDGIAFPYWGERLGWRSTGARTDRVGGRSITTVFYNGNNGERIGYAIVAGLPAPNAIGGAVAWRGAVPYRLLRDHGVPVVTWQRDGRLCVLSGRGVSRATLLRLASWGERSSVTS
jgi:hypothetical protein